jgi:hypothetical protein
MKANSSRLSGGQDSKSGALRSNMADVMCMALKVARPVWRKSSATDINIFVCKRGLLPPAISLNTPIEPEIDLNEEFLAAKRGAN